MGLSILGIFHTVIGVVAIVAAAIAFVRYGKIDLGQLTGKIYAYGTLVTSVTALGLSKHGGFNPGHVFSILIAVLVLISIFLYAKRTGNNRSRYFENFFLSFSFFLSWLPTINETFTRVPVGHPLAKSPGDPIIGMTLLVIFVLFIAGSVFQFRKQRQINEQSRSF